MPNDRRDSVFEEALALPSSEREAFLSRACSDDDALRAELTSLLAAHDAADGFFEALARDTAQPLQQSLGKVVTGVDDDPLTVGDIVAHYRVDARLGRGGMGVVYRATDTRLGRTVALKVLPMSSAGDSRAGTRLLEEARACSGLDHPHIGTVLDVGTLDGGLSADQMYMVMTYYDGETLADRLARGPVPVGESLRIARQLASALATAHVAGLVHRDVKPSNVLLTGLDGSVRLVDFGIAARVGAELPHTTAARGTRRYMSPERASGAPPDPRADVWSLGLVLRDLLDTRPNAASTPLPEALSELLHRSLDPDPARRPASAREVLAALEVIGDDDGPAQASMHGHIPMGRASAPLRHRWRSVGFGAAGLAAILLAWQVVPRARAAAGNGLQIAQAGLKANRVLVLPLEDRSGDSELASFGALAADFVAVAIAATQFAEAVPAMTAFAIARDGAPVPAGVDRIVHLAQPAGASYVITGSYIVQRDSLVVRASLSSGRDGRLVRALQTVVSARGAPREALSALARNAVVATALELDPLVRTDAMVPATPPNWDAYQAYARAKEHFLAKRYGESVEAFEAAYARDSSFRFPLFYQGMAYVNTGNWERLERVTQEFRRRQTAQSDPLERLALRILEAFLDGDWPRVYRVHREAEAAGMIGPGGLGHFSMGAVAVDVGRPREAVQIIRQSDPNRGELKGWSSYYDVLARAHLWLGELDAALEAARLLQSDHPGRDLGPRRAMEVFALQGRVAAVDSVLESALRITPAPGLLLRSAGNVLRLTGHEADALRQYARAVVYERDAVRRATGTSLPDARAALGESLILVGELDEAATIFRASAAEFPASMDPITSLGLIAARRGERDTVAMIDSVLAARALQRFNRGTATYRRARLAAAQGDGGRAARLLEQAWREGYSIYYRVWTDPEFVAVRAHPAVRALLGPKG